MPSLPPKKKILSMLAKESFKKEIEFFALFHIEIRVFLIYFVSGCSCNEHFVKHWSMQNIVLSVDPRLG